MDQKTIEEIRDSLAGVKFEAVLSDENRMIVAIRDANGKGVKLQEVQKNPHRRAHQFHSVQGLLEYVNHDRAANDIGAIFIGKERVAVDFNYRNPVAEVGAMPLGFAEEFRELLKLRGGVSQRELRRMLVTTLADAFPPDLAVAISSIYVKDKSEETIAIDMMGVKHGSSITGYQVSFVDDRAQSQAVTLSNRWLWKGRIYDASEATYEIPAVLEIEPKPLGFTFHVPRLEDALRAARLDLTKAIREKAPKHYAVYEGER